MISRFLPDTAGRTRNALLFGFAITFGMWVNFTYRASEPEPDTFAHMCRSLFEDLGSTGTLALIAAFASVAGSLANTIAAPAVGYAVSRSVSYTHLTLPTKA